MNSSHSMIEILFLIKSQWQRLSSGFPAAVLVFSGSMKLVSIVADQPWDSLLTKCLWGLIAIFEFLLGHVIASQWKFCQIMGIVVFLILATVSFVKAWRFVLSQPKAQN